MLRSSTILIVEDDPLARRALQSLFAINGYTVRAVASAEDALKLLHDSAAARPARVLIDIDLPGMNGLELLGRLQEEQPALACTLMSANDPDQVRRQRGVRAVPFFPKPLNMRRLLTHLRGARDAPAA
ncbi:MAG TPA: response regulator [Tepidisphaeraceae bacterium]